MKINSYKVLFHISVFTSALIIISCSNINQKTTTTDDKETKFTSIETSTYGGMMGYHDTWKFTKDSIYNNTIISMRDNQTSAQSFQMDSNVWNRLNETFSWDDFQKITNGESNMAFDGTDNKILVVAAGKTDSIINGEKDALTYKQISSFTKILDSLRTVFEKK